MIVSEGKKFCIATDDGAITKNSFSLVRLLAFANPVTNCCAFAWFYKVFVFQRQLLKLAVRVGISQQVLEFIYRVYGRLLNTSQACFRNFSDLGMKCVFWFPIDRYGEAPREADIDISHMTSILYYEVAMSRNVCIWCEGVQIRFSGMIKRGRSFSWYFHYSQSEHRFLTRDLSITTSSGDPQCLIIITCLLPLPPISCFPSLLPRLSPHVEPIKLSEHRLQLMSQ